MRCRLIAAVLLAATPLVAGVQYYLSDRLTSIDPTKWSTVGPGAASTTGLVNATANGGSLISKVKIPDSSSEVEVYAALTLAASGGTYTEFVQATPDAHTSSEGSGSYIAFEMQNPTFDSTGHCRANFLCSKVPLGMSR